MFMLSQLLINKETTVGVENPGYIDFRNIFKHAGAKITPLSIDKEGIEHKQHLSQCDYITVTPSHQYPTTVTMPIDKRKSILARAIRDNFIIIEDDYESEVNFLEKPLPALKSMDSYGRVIYLGSLSKSISPGLRIGYIVADKNLIHQLKAIRRLNYRHPPSNNQRAMALFISQGYYGSHVRRMRQVYAEKWNNMSEAIEKYLPNCNVIQTKGSFCFWLSLPEGIDSREVVKKSKQLGLLVQSGDDFFVDSSEQNSNDHSYIRLGFSAIATNKIDPGLKLLGTVINDLTKSQN